MSRQTGVQNMPQPSTEDDSSLLARVQSGDEQAMASIYDRYSRVVYSVALRVLRDPASAEDVLQEVFMQIWRLMVRNGQVSNGIDELEANNFDALRVPGAGTPKAGLVTNQTEISGARRGGQG